MKDNYQAIFGDNFLQTAEITAALWLRLTWTEAPSASWSVPVGLSDWLLWKKSISQCSLSPVFTRGWWVFTVIADDDWCRKRAVWAQLGLTWSLFAWRFADVVLILQLFPVALFVWPHFLCPTSSFLLAVVGDKCLQSGDSLLTCIQSRPYSSPVFFCNCTVENIFKYIIQIHPHFSLSSQS